MSMIKNSQHRRSSIATYTGVEFFPLAPRYEDIWVDDLAHALSLNCRYNGHCLEHYSVAQHSVLVSQFLHDLAGMDRQLEVEKWGLMHDAAEAYISDICAPIKPWIVGYKEMEEQLQYAVSQRFGLSWPTPEIVKYADKAVFGAELTSGIMPPCPWWELDPEHPNAAIDIKPLGPKEAEELFLNTFRELFGCDEYARLARP